MKLFICTTLNWDACRALGAGEIAEDNAAQRILGCSWLFRARPEVDAPAETAREAVREYFASPEGEAVLRREEIDSLSWDEAFRWIPDEVWDRHGLELIRYPDVEQILLDGSQNLLERPLGKRPQAPEAR